MRKHPLSLSTVTFAEEGQYLSIIPKVPFVLLHQRLNCSALTSADAFSLTTTFGGFALKF